MVKDLVEGDPFPESIVVTGECDVSVPTSLLCEDAGLTSLTPYLVVGGAVVGGVGVLLGRWTAPSTSPTKKSGRT